MYSHLIRSCSKGRLWTSPAYLTLQMGQVSTRTCFALETFFFLHTVSGLPCSPFFRGLWTIYSKNLSRTAPRLNLKQCHGIQRIVHVLALFLSFIEQIDQSYLAYLFRRWNPESVRFSPAPPNSSACSEGKNGGLVFFVPQFFPLRRDGSGTCTVPLVSSSRSWHCPAPLCRLSRESARDIVV